MGERERRNLRRNVPCPLPTYGSNGVKVVPVCRNWRTFLEIPFRASCSPCSRSFDIHPVIIHYRHKLFSPAINFARCFFVFCRDDTYLERLPFDQNRTKISVSSLYVQLIYPLSCPLLRLIWNIFFLLARKIGDQGRMKGKKCLSVLRKRKEIYSRDRKILEKEKGKKKKKKRKAR